MIVYLAFLIALVSAGSAGKSSAASVSPGTHPSEINGEKVFFTPTVDRPRRNDI
jgi:hypothetical protein